MKLIRIAVGLYLATCAGCAFRPGEAPEELKPIEAQSSASPSDDALVSWELVALPEPHKFSVHWQLRDLSLARGLRLRRETDPGQFREAAALIDEEGRGVDEQVFEEQIYRYELVSATGPSGAPVSLGRWMVKIPRDEIIEGVRELSSLPPQVHRLFFKSDSVLRTLGIDRVLEVEEIHADGATIESFAADTTAGPLSAGRPGGHLQIKARRGSGRLRIVMRGEAGGQGERGASGAVGAAGEAGSNGLYHSVFRVCARNPEDGKRGKPGHSGGKGAQGRPGGTSGGFEVTLDEVSPIVIEPVLEGGRGGAGGMGGIGGAGGPGGPAGRTLVIGGGPGMPIPGLGCRPAHEGPHGERGPEGPAGDMGPTGVVENACVRNGSQTFGHCP